MGQKVYKNVLISENAIGIKWRKGKLYKQKRGLSPSFLFEIRTVLALIEF